jgi:hypothetical protein
VEINCRVKIVSEIDNRNKDAALEAYFFLSEARANAYNVHHVALYNTNICQVTTTECVKILPFTFTLLLLLRQTTLAKRVEIVAMFRFFS